MPLEQAKAFSESSSDNDEQTRTPADDVIKDEIPDPFTDAQVESMMEAAAGSWFETIDSVISEENALDLNSPWRYGGQEDSGDSHNGLDAVEFKFDDSYLDQIEDNPLINLEPIDQIEW